MIKKNKKEKDEKNINKYENKLNYIFKDSKYIKDG